MLALMSDGRVRRARLGIACEPRPLPPAARATWGDDPCVEVVQVVAGSPADTGGLRAGDLLVELAGRRVTGVADLQKLLDEDCIGARVVVDVVRDGRTRRLTVVPDELTVS